VADKAQVPTTPPLPWPRPGDDDEDRDVPVATPEEFGLSTPHQLSPDEIQHSLDLYPPGESHQHPSGPVVYPRGVYTTDVRNKVMQQLGEDLEKSPDLKGYPPDVADVIRKKILGENLASLEDEQRRGLIASMYKIHPEVLAKKRLSTNVEDLRPGAPLGKILSSIRDKGESGNGS
jgi:hypothetical protein